MPKRDRLCASEHGVKSKILFSSDPRAGHFSLSYFLAGPEQSGKGFADHRIVGLGEMARPRMYLI